MVSASPLATQVSMRNMEVVDDVCRSAFGCGGIELSTIALVLITGFLAIVVFAAIIHVREAMSIVDEERTRLAAERDAFDAFSRRLSAMEVSEAPVAVPAAGGIAAASVAGPDDRLDRVRAAYRDTVMDVPHYDVDYGEPLSVNLAAEFGDGLSYAVVDGRQLTPQLKSALLEASREASHSRSSFLSTLDDEAEALSEAAASIEALDDERASGEAVPFTERSYDELVRDWRRLGDLRERCSSLLRERQEGIRALRSGERPDLHEYLYEELPVTHPVLSDGLSLAESIDALRSQILQSLTRRV